MDKSTPPEEQPLISIDSRKALQQFIKTEVNFLIYPSGTVWGKSKEKTITYRKVIKENNIEKEIVWSVLGSDKYGLPGPGALETDIAITKIINDRGWPVPKWIDTTYYEIAKVRGIIPQGNNLRLIKKDLKELATTSYESIFTFRSKWDKEKKYLDAVFHKYDTIVLVGESVPPPFDKEVPSDEKGKSAKVYIILSDPYRNSLNSFYTRQIDFTYLMSLPGILTKRLYQLLNFAFATQMDSETQNVTYTYLELCGRIPIYPQKYLSDAKRNLAPHLEELVKTGYIKRYEWITNESKEFSNWKLCFYIGYLAKNEITNNKFQGMLPFLTEEKRYSKQEVELVNYFLKIYGYNREPSSKEIEQVQRLLEEGKYSFDLIKYMVDFVYNTIPKYEPKFFGGVLAYKDLAVDKWNKEIKSKELEKEEQVNQNKEQEITRKQQNKDKEILQYFKTLNTKEQDKIRVRSEQILQEKYNGMVSEISQQFALLEAIEEYKNKMGK